MDGDVNVMAAGTYGKCNGLYGERAGILAVVVAPNNGREGIVAKRIEKPNEISRARAETGTMPCFGAKIVETILCDEGEDGLRKLWEEDVKFMAAPLKLRRRKLRGWLEKELKTPGGWKWLEEQGGMFAMGGNGSGGKGGSGGGDGCGYGMFNAEQVEKLRREWHVYLQDNGRISIA